MKPAPKDWPRISSSIYYEDANVAIKWLCKAFGFEVRLIVPGENGKVEHSELTYGDGLIMVGDVSGRSRYPFRRAPKSVGGGNTQNMMVYVDDVETHCARARAAGATIASEPATVDYGEDYWSDRGYEAEDIGGHHWWFYQRLRNPPAKK